MNFWHIYSSIASAQSAIFLPLSLIYLLGTSFIAFAKKHLAPPPREYTPETHQLKQGTPSMGGLLMVGAALFSLLFSLNLCAPEFWLMSGSLIFFGLIGLWDDLSKTWYRQGISERAKFAAQFSAAGVLTLFWYYLSQPTTLFQLPFLSHYYSFDMGLLLIPWTMFVIIGSSNAVNLTDGLDGLASTLLSLNFLFFSLLAACQNNLHVALGSLVLASSCASFLYYNRYPARIFMGDVGSLSLGGTLGFIACMLRQELLLPLTGIILVCETVSVMAQVAYYKKTGKRLFRRAPLHHHFELSGWPERKITGYFSLITLCFCALVFVLVLYTGLCHSVKAVQTV